MPASHRSRFPALSYALLLVVTAMLPVWRGDAAVADSHAVALLYHHVSGATPAATSVAPERFRAHLDYLDEHDFTVMALGAIVERLRGGDEVPPDTVAITFDDAYRSVYTTAFPLLRERGWPFSVFVNSEAIDAGYDHYMNWAQLRELAQAGVEIGNHGHSHAHLVRRRADESEKAWRARVEADLLRARARLMEEIPGADGPRQLFAYPYGEYCDELKAILRAHGYTGIAQQSGALGPHSDFLALPRFPMATGFAGMERFVTAVRARPLRVRRAVEVPRGSEHGLEQLALHIPDAETAAAQIACYSSGGKTVPLQRGTEDGGAVLRLDLRAFNAPGRNKVNCTAPVAGERDAFYWYSHQWLARRPDGSWYQE